MKHLKTFDTYVYENTNEAVSPLNENQITYVSDEKFTDEATLKADILEKAGPALVTFLKDHGLDWPADYEIKDGGNRLQLVSKPITGDALGIMQYGFSEVYIVFFGGGTYPKVNKAAKEAFEFEPVIWCQLNYSYKHPSGGSNGTNLILPGERRSDLFYSVVEGKWYTESEAEKAKLF